MVETNLTNSTTTSLKTAVKAFSVSSQSLDSPTNKENIYDNPDFKKNLGYYKTIPEFKKALDALTTWSCGKGWVADDETAVILEGMTGNGKQSFQQIMQSHLAMKKINGDAYLHIIRNEKGSLINLKLLNPERIRVFYNENGIIVNYGQTSINGKEILETFEPEEILHSMNDPIGDEIHGVSALEACKWIIDSRNESMADWRRILHRSTIRILYVDIDNPTKLAQIKTQWHTAIKDGEILILPAKPGEVQVIDFIAPPLEAFLGWIRYLEDFFYKAVGIPKIIMGGSSEFTQTDAKIGYLTFDPVYTKEQLELEADLWNQVGIKVDFQRPVQLGGLMNENEDKNTGQTGFQEAELNPGTTE